MAVGENQQGASECGPERHWRTSWRGPLTSPRCKRGRGGKRSRRHVNHATQSSRCLTVMLQQTQGSTCWGQFLSVPSVHQRCIFAGEMDKTCLNLLMPSLNLLSGVCVVRKCSSLTRAGLLAPGSSVTNWSSAAKSVSLEPSFRNSQLIPPAIWPRSLREKVLLHKVFLYGQKHSWVLLVYSQLSTLKATTWTSNPPTSLSYWWCLQSHGSFWTKAEPVKTNIINTHYVSQFPTVHLHFIWLFGSEKHFYNDWWHF